MWSEKMPIDASLYAAFAPRAKGALEYAQDFAGLDAARQAQQAGALNQQMGQAKFDEYQRGVQDQNALRQLMGSLAGKDDAAVLAGLRGAGRFNEAGAMEEGLLKRQKLGVDVREGAAKAGKTEFETKEAKKKQAILDIAVLPDFEGARASISAKVTSGELPMQMAQGILQSMPQDPAQFATWKNNLILKMAAPEAQLTAQTQTRGQDMTAATAAAGQQVTRETAAQADARIRAEGAANRAVQMRGQNLTDARTRESTAATMTKPFEVTGPDGLPLLVQQDRQGNIVPVQGFGPKSGSAKPLNDTQAKALLFGTRMQEADKVLAGLAKTGSDMPSITKRIAEGVPVVGGALGSMANFAASPEQQQVEQAQRDFINAVLRRESGAAIADSEFANARKQYFVEPGDSPAVKRQKARNRQLSIDGLLAEVPEGRRTSITPQAPDAPPAAPGRVVDFSSLK